MNRLLLLAAAVAISGSLASAASITATCINLSTVATPSGAGTTSCVGTGLVPPGSTINSIVFTYSFDINFNPQAGGFPSATFAASIPSTTMAVSGVVVSSAIRPVTGSVNSVNIGNDYNFIRNPFNVEFSWTANVPPLNNISADFQVTVNYTPLTTGGGETPGVGQVPEPATLGLVGSSLIGLGWIARRRKS